MAKVKRVSASETAELLNKVYVGFFLCLGITSGGKALKFLVTGEAAGVEVLDWIRIGALISAMVLMLAFIWMAKNLKCAERQVFWGNEFIHYVFNKAMVISWFFTWVLLMFLGELSESEVMFIGKIPETSLLPAEFYLSAAVSMMLLVYCIAYVFLYRRSNAFEETE